MSKVSKTAKKKEASELFNASLTLDNEDQYFQTRHSNVLCEKKVVPGKRMYRSSASTRKSALTKKVLELKNTNSSFIEPSDPLHVKKGKRAVISRHKDSTSDSKFESTSSENSDSSDNEEVESTDAVRSNNKEISLDLLKSQQHQLENGNKPETFLMKSDDFFTWQATSKVLTSNHTLKKLQNCKLTQNQLQTLLSSSCKLKAALPHKSNIRHLFRLNCLCFQKWWNILNEGFNILLYGLGSKRDILKTFQCEMLQKFPVIVVNGYFPSLSIKDVIDAIVVNVLKQTSTNISDSIQLIKKQFLKRNKPLYIIIHNIEGPMLIKSQSELCALAAIPKIHMIASVDHINAPLIWDYKKLRQFNFIWWDTTSFLPYSDETSFEDSLLVQKSGALALTSLTTVYQSLTKNSKGVFMIIVTYQLSNKAVKHYQGMPFKVLYLQCRENFLVSSDLALRAQLTEFVDHKLIKMKRSTDGTELLLIPIQQSLLQQFVEQQQS